MRVYQTVFLYSLYGIFILNILVIFGISTLAPIYLKNLKTFMQVYIGALLVYFYNPITYKKDKKFEEFDRKLIFASGSFLLLTSVLMNYLENYIGLPNLQNIGQGIRSYLKV